VLRPAKQARWREPGQNRAAVEMRWMQVFVRVEGDWRLAASQATGVAPTT
jgi:hypothetical protein